MDKIVKEQILFKVNEIDKLFLEYRLIFEKVEQETPDLFDMTILGSVLHSFYNGIENIFEIISKNIDKKIPVGNKYHQELLYQMTQENSERKSILSEEMYLALREYLAFRHFYRHAYSFQLDWEKMEPLVKNIFIIWKKAKGNIIKIVEE